MPITYLSTDCLISGFFLSISLLLLVLTQIKEDATNISTMTRNKKLLKRVSQRRKSSRVEKTAAKRLITNISDSESDISEQEKPHDPLRFGGISPQVATALAGEDKASEHAIKVPNGPIKKDNATNVTESKKNTICPDGSLGSRSQSENKKRYCLPNCKYGGNRGRSEMLKCCQCMDWFHPVCCGDLLSESDIGIYNCSNCRQISSRLFKVEKQIESLHAVNKDLIRLLESSQQECASLRSMLQTLVSENNPPTQSDQGLNAQEAPNNKIKNVSKPTPMPRAKNRTSQKTPESTCNSRKPVVTLYGDSMVRGCGEILSSSLTSQDTCVLSTSGLTLDRASDQIGQLGKEFRDGDTFVLHIGTNNNELHGKVIFAIQYLDPHGILP